MDGRLIMLQCPYCWEQIEVIVDWSVTHQEYTEDCSVCCNPIMLEIESSDDEVVKVEARMEND
jgi:hypothetical protein